MALNESQIQRYSRQLLLQEVGGAGQERLAAATVLVAGAGALGAPIASYLACAGVGHLILADGDQVELSNLQRQFQHTIRRIGMPKAESAAVFLREINPEIRLTPVTQRLTPDNVWPWVEQCDVIADGTDNFASRYLLNHAAHHGGKPLVSGAVLGFDGQIAVFPNGGTGQTPCYQCLFPDPPAAATPTCATAGVLGPLPGMIGSLQALEVIKLVLSIGEPLSGALLMVNGLHGIFHKISVAKNPQCPTCSLPRNPRTRFSMAAPECRG